jgi:prepilin-type N-terminal cleavage/methylation domain-containing protein
MKKGFTLLELLVVIAIIGVLASIVMASLNSARSKARDAKRLSDVSQIKTALELYFNQYGYYPDCSGNDVCSSTGYAGSIYNLGVVPDYIKIISSDPKNIGGQYGYYYARTYKKTSNNSYVHTGNNYDYILASRFENGGSSPFAGWDNSSLNYIQGN